MYKKIIFFKTLLFVWLLLMYPYAYLAQKPDIYRCFRSTAHERYFGAEIIFGTLYNILGGLALSQEVDANGDGGHGYQRLLQDVDDPCCTLTWDRPGGRCQWWWRAWLSKASPGCVWPRCSPQCLPSPPWPRWRWLCPVKATKLFPDPLTLPNTFLLWRCNKIMNHSVPTLSQNICFLHIWLLLEFSDTVHNYVGIF